jgi:hypothetical protein
VANPNGAQESRKRRKFRQEIAVRPVTLMLEVSPEHSMSLFFSGRVESPAASISGDGAFVVRGVTR